MNIIDKNCRLYLENALKFNTFHLGVCFHQPLGAETAAKNRLLALILSESCEKYDTKVKLNRALAELGGAELNIQTVKKGAVSILQFIISAPKGNEEACFALLNEVIYHPLLNDGDFAVSKKEYLNNLIADKISDPKAYALDRCIELMFDGRGFGTDADGKTEVVDKISGLYEYYLYVLANSKTEMFAVGSYEEEKVLLLADKYFAGLKSTEIKIDDFLPAEFKRVEEKSKTAQTRLCIGLEMGQGSRFEKMLFNEIFGGGNSMLFREIRENNSLCYYIGSTYYSLANAAIIQAGIKYSDAEKVTELVRMVLDRTPSEDEIKRAKTTITDRLKSIGDRPLALVDFYITQGIVGENISPDDMINEINNISSLAVKPEIKMIYLFGGKENDSKNT